MGLVSSRGRDLTSLEQWGQLPPSHRTPGGEFKERTEWARAVLAMCCTPSQRAAVGAGCRRHGRSPNTKGLRGTSIPSGEARAAVQRWAGEGRNRKSRGQPDGSAVAPASTKREGWTWVSFTPGSEVWVMAMACSILRLLTLSPAGAAGCDSIQMASLKSTLWLEGRETFTPRRGHIGRLGLAGTVAEWLALFASV